ncbi:YdhK family protein [Ureibacillus manganicus]|uniref:DUF1541 domain-containing protein n=1 Tax=Ureibacillus manganicus DSM 26584 TaxID=1384049 RepID=A0A0A3I9V6_9BACL|nr:YdhK family protein [Ureibacillus manganicus]KGR80250.1 hypothetical protein CD29_02530 [Ureibacillus manganicus DSM 26584]
MKNRLIFGAVSLLLLLLLAACGNDNAKSGDTNNTNNTANSGADVTNKDANMASEEAQSNQTDQTMDSELTNNATLSEIPEGMKVAENSKFKVGDEVTINAEHEEDMKGSNGTITGAFDTIVYSVSYQPTHDDFREENHKWVVQEELQGIDEEMLVPGSEVIIETNQEEGMFGAEGEIDTAEKTIVYMVEYISTQGTSHKKWFKESELSAK